MQIATRPVWLDGGQNSIVVIDQRLLPHKLMLKELHNIEEIIDAIKTMVVRGAPLIGVVAAYGVYLAAAKIPLERDDFFDEIVEELRQARPTAVNLARAVDYVYNQVKDIRDSKERKAKALKAAQGVEATENERCRLIGQHGLALIEEISRRKEGAPVNILTHCNAGWLACVEWGTATAPIYMAHEKGVKVHVWVDETRPWNQGSRLTAWELAQSKVPCTIIADNAGGHLMQHGLVDIVIVGADRVSAHGDVANKVGTYLTALAAHANDVPFYAALPSSTIDWQVHECEEIPIEERNPNEVLFNEGLAPNGEITRVRIAPANAKALNIGFDVTPAELVTGLITERGVCPATEDALYDMFHDKAPNAQ